MGTDEFTVAVSRRIEAPAEAIFAILADPGRHPDVDGSGMLRTGATNSVVSGVDDMFVMKMHRDDLGDYVMNNYVVEFEANRRIGWEPGPGEGHPAAAESPVGTRGGWRWTFDLAPDGPAATVVTEIYDCAGAPAWVQEATGNGQVWMEGMTKSLERLDELCAKE
jgi:uncharacterized protein YndB with AHSA1/START domain